MTSAGYTFGTTPTAAERLLVVARVFDPTMAAVLATLPTRRWRHVLDLGCGPGSSTARLRVHVDADDVMGLDASTDFVAAAATRVRSARFAHGDVRAPFPVHQPDLVYARYVLSHLRDPVQVVAGWVGQLAADGHLVLEEPERIDTDDEVPAAYLALTGGLVASRGADMYVGRSLAGVAGTVLNRPFALDVPTCDAALMFGMNLATIRDDPWVQATHGTAELDRLARELHARTLEPPDARPPVRWQVRQVVTTLAAWRGDPHT